MKKVEVKLTKQGLIAIDDRNEQCGIPLYDGNTFRMADAMVFVNWIRDRLLMTPPGNATMDLLQIAIRESMEKIVRPATRDEILVTCDVPQKSIWRDRLETEFNKMVAAGEIIQCGDVPRAGTFYKLKEN